MRHLAIGGGTLRELNQLRAPMAAVFEFFLKQKEELDRYKERYGELDDERRNGVADDVEDDDDDDDDEGSDTEQE